ncbi:hypothetical protein [Halorussus halophilus]|uniref:hypothetical protein n=1 Tax=Halorussus halophilus TaxID=2650975 RepID=UPI0013017939|nr:hypothetical protein [Halorussus halophilus]
MAQMESDESKMKRVTVRVPKALVEEYDEVVENRSEGVRTHMKRIVKNPVTDGGREPPRDDDALAKGYETLKSVSCNGQAIPLREAKSIIASQANVPKESVSRRIIEPLRERGYIARIGDPIQDPWLEVR